MLTMTKKDIKRLEMIGNLALLEAQNIHNQLGKSGEEVISKNQFGETALKVDIEAEKAVLRIFEEKRISIKVISEEHGIVIIGNNPKLIGILDGLDGSGLYKKQRGKARYGTMLGIYNSTDPSYKDYVYGGIIVPTQSKLYFASINNGAFLMTNGKTEQIHCFLDHKLDPKSIKICIDTEFDRLFGTKIFTDVAKIFSGYNLSCAKSTAIHYADLVTGDADLVFECTRKGNIELAAAFPIINEAGGVTIDQFGQNIAYQKYLKFGQNRHLLVISASNLSLAKAVVDKLNFLQNI